MFEEERRAITEQQKEEVVTRLFTAWKKAKHLRLGQLIVASNGADPFYAEDFALVERVEKLVEDLP